MADSLRRLELMAHRFSAMFQALLCAFILQAFTLTHGQSTNPPSLSIVVATGEQGLRIAWPSSASDFVLEETGVVNSNWQSSALGPALSGNEFVVNLTPTDKARFFRIRKMSNLSAFRILSHTPSMDATEVGVTYRPQIFFSRKARPGTLSTNSIYATVGGKVIPANVVPASDGSFAWLFFKSALPGAAKVRVMVDGSLIASEGELSLLDADGDGRQGGLLEYEFTTVSLAELAGTSLVGIVVEPGPDMIPRTADDLQAGADGMFGTLDDVFTYPLSGLRVFLHGRETNVVTTAADGRFRFDAVPAGNVKIVVDGTTAGNRPAGVYFPEMVLDAEMILGKENWSMTNGHEVYLPRLSTNILQAVTAGTNSTLVKATAEGAMGLSAFQRNLLTVDIAPNSLVSQDGQILTNGGQVGISTVPADVVRDMLPPGILQHTFDITVQAPGVATLSTPAPMTFPNIFNQPPGTKLNFLSFDHTTGRLVIEGTATVSEDGTYVRTDPGTGITHPGWHGLTPPGGPNDPPCPPGGVSDFVVPPVPVVSGIRNQFSAKDDETFLIAFGNAAALIDPASGPCSGQNARATPLVIDIEIEGPAAEFLDGLPPARVILHPGQQNSFSIKFKPLLADPKVVRKMQSDAFYGARVFIRGYRQDSSAPLINESFFVYRYVDVSDLDRADGVLEFAATLAEGAGGIMRSRGFEFKMPESIRPQWSIPSQDFKFTEEISEFHFDPLQPTGRVSTQATLRSPLGTLVGQLELRGTATAKNRVFLNKPGLANFLEEIVNGTTVSAVTNAIQLTNAEKDMLSTPEQRSAIADEIEAEVLQKYAELQPGIELASSDGTNTVKVEWIVGPPHEFGLSRQDRIDHVESIFETLRLRDTLNAPARAFALSKSINTNFTTSVEVYPENLLKEWVDVPFSQSREQFIYGLSKIVAHEIAHSLGAPHTSAPINRYSTTNEQQRIHIGTLASGETFVLEFDGLQTDPLSAGASATQVQTALRALDSIGAGNVTVANTPPPFTVEFTGALSGADVPPLSIIAPSHAGANVSTIVNGKILLNYTDAGLPDLSGRSDIMSAGDNDFGGLLSFNPKLSLEILQLGLKLNWTVSEAEDALNSYIRSQAAKLFNAGDGELSEEYEGPGLAVFTADADLGDFTMEFGRVKSDGPGAEKKIFLVGFMNFGNEDLEIESIEINDDSGSFDLSGAASNIIIPPGSTILRELTCDPTESGELEATLEIESNDPNFVGEFTLTATGWKEGADIQVRSTKSNLGGVSVGTNMVVTNYVTITNAGGQPLTITKVASTENAFAILGFNTVPLALAPGQGVTLGLRFKPERVGFVGGSIEIFSNDADTPIHRLPIAGLGLSVSGNPLDSLHYGEDYVAIESPDFPDTPVLRARSDANGDFEFFLPPEQRYHLVIFDPVSGLIAHMYGITAPSGQNTQFGTPTFLPSTAPDSDGDGLPDDVEFAIGSNPNDADTDGNGLPDLAEVAQGRDPLGDQVAATGIIGRLAMNQARSVTLYAPAGGDPNALHAYVGDGTTMHIVDLANPVIPVVMSSLQVIGTVSDIAVDPLTQSAVVGAAGLSLVKIENPAAPVVYHTIPFEGAEVECANGYAYAAKFAGHELFASLRSIDLVSTSAVHTLVLPVREVDCMVLEADLLYVLGNRTLMVVKVDGTNMMLRSTLPVPFGKGRFSVANGIAYIPFEGDSSTGVTGGYITVDLSDPDEPRIIQSSQAPAGAAAPGLMIAANGSGLGLLAGQVGVENPWAVDVMNTSDPNNTYAFLTRFNLPRGGLPMALQVGGGLGVLANWTGGLVVLNYLNADIAGQPPQVGALRIQPDGNTNLAGVQLIEGRSFYVSAELVDDVQVRSVELIVDGIVVQRSISAPFVLSAVAPNLAEKSSVVVQIRAVDTGGNASLSAAVELPILFDPVAPSLLQIDPAEGELKGRGFKQARLVFSKPMGSPAARTQNFALRTAAGQNLPIHSAALQEGDRAVVVNFDRLEPGNYVFTTRQSQITDRAGNVLGASDIVRGFSVDEYSIRWVNRTNVNTSWFVKTNWFPARVPEEEDSILIDVPGTNALVTIAPPIEWQRLGLKLPVRFRKLDCFEELIAAFVELHPSEHIFVDSRFRPTIALIKNGVLKAGPNNLISSGPLQVENVVMEGAIRLNLELDVRKKLTLNGTIRGDSDLSFGSVNGNLRVPYSAVIDGQGEFVNVGATFAARVSEVDPIPLGQEITIRPGITFTGHGTMVVDGNGNRVLNQGSFIYDVPFTNVFSSPRSHIHGSHTTNEFINLGLIEVKNGAFLELGGTFLSRFINQGTIKVSDRGYLNIAGAYLVTSNLICEPTAYVSFEGRLLTPAGGVSQLTGGGTWLVRPAGQFASGSAIPIRLFGTNAPVAPNAPQAILRLVNGAALEGSPTFEDMTLEGDLHNYDPNTRRAQLPQQFNGYTFTIGIRSNFTLNGTIHFHRTPTDEIYGQLAWGPGVARLDGVGRIIFERGRYGAGIFQPDRLVVGQGITIDMPEVTFNGFSLENRGTINVLTPGANNNIPTFTNSGTIRIATSATFTNLNLKQTATGQLIMEAAGTQPGVSHGWLRNRSIAELAGTLSLQPVGGFQPSVGSSFEVLTFFSRTGDFSSYVTPPPPAGAQWQNQFGSTNLVLRLIPASAPVSTMLKSYSEIPHTREVEHTFAEETHADELNPFPMTLMAWVKAEGAGEEPQNLISKLRQDPLSGYTIYLDAGRLRAHYFRDETIGLGNEASGLDGGFLADGQWHHIAFSVDETGAVLIIDGVLKAEAGWNSDQRIFNGLGGGSNTREPLVIGQPFFEAAPAVVDQVSLWDDFMDAEEVILRQAIPLDSKTEGLVWQWQSTDRAK
jgi:hypothetical protein